MWFSYKEGLVFATAILFAVLTLCIISEKSEGYQTAGWWYHRGDLMVPYGGVCDFQENTRAYFGEPFPQFDPAGDWMQVGTMQNDHIRIYHGWPADLRLDTNLAYYDYYRIGLWMEPGEIVEEARLLVESADSVELYFDGNILGTAGCCWCENDLGNNSNIYLHGLLLPDEVYVIQVSHMSATPYPRWSTIKLDLYLKTNYGYRTLPVDNSTWGRVKSFYME